jgi:hypothetical protein
MALRVHTNILTEANRARILTRNSRILEELSSWEKARFYNMQVLMDEIDAIPCHRCGVVINIADQIVSKRVPVRSIYYHEACAKRVGIIS